jgi:cystathionine beta-synthase
MSVRIDRKGEITMAQTSTTSVDFRTEQPTAPGPEETVRLWELLKVKTHTPALISVESSDTLLRAVSLMRYYDISQLPVIDAGQNIGAITETLILKLLQANILCDEKIKDLMAEPLPALDGDATITQACRVLSDSVTGVVVTEAGKPVGLITRADLLQYWARNKEREDFSI